MQSAMLLAFSITSWFNSVVYEVTSMFSQMNTLQWGIVSSAAVAFGFLCLKGTGVNR